MEEEFKVRLARTRSDFEACLGLERSVFGLPDLELTSAVQLIASVHAGGIVTLAEDSRGGIVGFAYAFPALRGGVPHFHADMLAVRSDLQARGLGARLKWAQRDEALRRGIGFVSWTSDPMQARPANLNLRRLGATAPQFVTDFYGRPAAGLPGMLSGDRLLVRWDLRAADVEERANSPEPPRTVETPPFPRINEVKWQAGWPVSSEPVAELADEALLLEIPPDWDVLCQAAPRVAQDWHAKVRKALRYYFGRGYGAAGFAPTEERGRRRPLYVLRKSEDPAA
jgi:predicted GNAT superfamily acetyltransferase